MVTRVYEGRTRVCILVCEISIKTLLKKKKREKKAARGNSAPGLSGVPYKLDKKCPGLLYRLWSILKAIWKRGRVAQQWSAEGLWIPKEEEPKNLILDYYCGLDLRLSAGTTISAWHKLEEGIIPGCTISVTRFSLAMNMLLKLF